MAARTPEEHLTWYVINYYGGLMTKAEWLAYRNFLVDGKVRAGYSPELLEDRTSDPEALSLMSDGIEVFMLRVCERILHEHKDRVILNCCPKCGGLAKTPKARQCHWCFYAWHEHERGSSR